MAAEERSKGLNKRFVDVAEEALPPETFAALLRTAEERLAADAGGTKPAPETPPTPVRHEDKLKANKAGVIERISAAINARAPEPVKSHVAERLVERAKIDAGPQDVAELTNFILARGPNVERVKRVMHTVEHLRVNWRGQNFVAIMDMTRLQLITIFQNEKRVPRHKGVRYPNEAPRARLSLRNIPDDGDDEISD